MACSLSPAACYSVYDGDGVLLLRSEDAPVDLQYHLGDVVPAKFGAKASMIFATDNGVCHEANGPGDGPTVRERAVDSVTTAPVVFVPTGVAAAALPLAAAGVYAFPRYSNDVGRRSAIGGSSASYPHTGPRGGVYGYTSSGKKSYRSKRR